jgi:ABC-2 type transport system permease protein
MRNILTLLRFETKRLLKSKISFLYAAIYGICFLISAYFYSLYGSEASVLITPNGQSFAIQHLQASFLFTGVFVAIFASSLILQERTNGTIKYILTRPVTRGEFFVSRVLSLTVFVIFISFMMIVIGYIVGIACFGWGDYMEFANLRYPPIEGVFQTLKAALAFSYAYLGYGMMALVVSMFMDQMTTSVTVMTLLIMVGQYAEVLPTLKIGVIMHQMLFYHIDLFQASQAVVILNGFVIGLYIVVFFSLGWVTFRQQNLKV